MTDLFNEKAKDWDVNDMVLQLSKATSSAIKNNITLNNQMQVMDFGAGTGLITSHILPHVKKITAVDVSEAMLEKLAAKPELKNNVEVLCQDIIEQPLDQKFDLIMSAMALHHVKDTNLLFQRFTSLLETGAKVALVDLDAEDGSFHPQDVEGVYHSGFERQHIQTLLEQNGFDDVQFVTAHTVNKESKSYPIFLVTATKT